MFDNRWVRMIPRHHQQFTRLLLVSVRQGERLFRRFAARIAVNFNRGLNADFSPRGHQAFCQRDSPCCRCVVIGQLHVHMKRAALLLLRQ